MTEQVDNIYTALAKAQSEMSAVKKSAENRHFNSRYADLGDVMDAIRPALNKHGIALWFSSAKTDEDIFERTTMTHGASGTSIHYDALLMVDRKNMQGMKSAITYARRIGLEGLGAIAPEDDDGNDAAAAAPQKKAAVKNTTEQVNSAIAALKACESLDDLKAAFTGLHKSIQSIPEVIETKNDRKAALAPTDDLGGALDQEDAQ